MRLGLFTLLGTAWLALAAPGPIAQGSDAFCDKNGLRTIGEHTVYNNLWGQDRGTGSQCTSVDSVEGNTVKWNTKWSWSGSIVEVKSYANAVVKTNPVPLSSIKSLHTSWAWSYAGNEINANAAYDMFTASTANGPSEFEIMVWLSAIGPKAVPIGGTQPPIAEVDLAGARWKLYHGPNGNMNVYSFVAAGELKWFSADLMVFLNYMADHQGIPKSHILQTVHAGTEAFTGWDAVFTTTSYTLSQSGF